MSGVVAESGSSPGSQLLTLAMAHPDQALVRARAVLETSPPPEQASIAHQAVAIVLRDRERHTEAVPHYRAALRLARRVGAEDRVAEVEASFAAAELLAGHSARATHRLDRALARARGPLTVARIRYFRAGLLMHLGRHWEARAELHLASETFGEREDVVWSARAQLALAWAETAAGHVEAARAASLRAEAGFARAGQLFEALEARRLQAEILGLAGDLPAAITLLDECEEGFSRLSLPRAAPALDRARMLLLARLWPEARELAETVAADEHTPAPVRADLLLAVAEAAWADGETEAARTAARQARALLLRQRRRQAAALAHVLVARTELAEQGASVGLARRIVQLADELDAAGWAGARATRLLAAQVALAVRRPALAAAQLQLAAVNPGSGVEAALGPFDRATVWVARAELARLDGDVRGILRACRRGLAELAAARAVYGDAELRAVATGHAADLTRLALGTVAERRRARDVLVWSERSRAVTLAGQAVRPPPDDALARALTSTRDAARRAHEVGDPLVRDRILREQRRGEAEVRRLLRTRTGPSGGPGDRWDERAVLRAVGADALVSLVDVDATLYAVLVTRGRVSRHRIGPTRAAVAEAEFARFALRRAAYRGVSVPPAVGRAFGSAVLGPLAARLPPRVVLVPPAALHVAPWSLVPELADRTVSVAPSVRAWLRARATPVPAHRRTVLVTGPGLSTREQEAGDVRGCYRDPQVLSGPGATVAAVLPALDGAAVVHLAAHGSFRADAPMFSALTLADGPLFVHDLDRLAEPAHTLILSACDAGDIAAVGVDEGLGLVTTLVGMGTAQVLASVVPVNDAATVRVMRALHEALAAGGSLAAAALAARSAHRGDPEAYAAAVSFTAWGA